MSAVQDLATFLLARANDPDISEPDQLRCAGVVASYRSGSAEAESEIAMRQLALRFATHPDYRYEWRPEISRSP